MLAEVGLLSNEDLSPIQQELKNIFKVIEMIIFLSLMKVKTYIVEIEFRLTEKTW